MIEMKKNQIGMPVKAVGGIKCDVVSRLMDHHIDGTDTAKPKHVYIPGKRIEPCDEERTQSWDFRDIPQLNRVLYDTLPLLDENGKIVKVNLIYVNSI